MEDLDLCLYGKQDMKVVQINDQPSKHPPKEVNSDGGDSSNAALATSTPASGIGIEDTKKPARCKFLAKLKNMNNSYCIKVYHESISNYSKR